MARLSKNRKKIGRPSKLTHPVIGKVITDAICQNIRDLAPRKAAVCLAGIAYKTYLEWMERAENGQQPFLDFRNQIELAEFETQKDLMGKWLGHCDNDWRAIDRFLQVRFKDEFGQQNGAQVNINADKVVIVVPEKPGTEEWLKQLEQLKSSDNYSKGPKAS